MNRIKIYTDWGGGLWLQCRTLANVPSLKRRARVNPVILGTARVAACQRQGQCLPLDLRAAMLWMCFHSSEGSDSLCRIRDSSPSAWSRLCQ